MPCHFVLKPCHFFLKTSSRSIGSHGGVARHFRRAAGRQVVRHCLCLMLCLVLPLPLFAKTLPLCPCCAARSYRNGARAGDTIQMFSGEQLPIKRAMSAATSATRPHHLCHRSRRCRRRHRPPHPHHRCSAVPRASPAAAAAVFCSARNFGVFNKCESTPPATAAQCP